MHGAGKLNGGAYAVPTIPCVLYRLDEDFAGFLRLGNMTTDIVRFNHTLTEWLVEYNFRRPHATLGYISPINFIYRHHRLLPMTSSDTQS